MKPGDKESSCCISTYSIATLYLRVHERKKERKKSHKCLVLVLFSIFNSY